ncbi:hypothetical protein KTO58_10990 [Chitinophaga pendula]|uniref:alpha/beta hydrolase-fold protein n=1 Tax=Chitinophaga TaxID=79328 RepID=UPI000BB02332|nr:MULTISPECIES: alpha/beta hydrolase-fold protein [Chitinophaga]ASZ12697.1 hypothetical protein CK934_17900 [Chitinophaga sp. MD30]UCJ09690.1 hypothetical protein KTO58_10990 [Chitinophaga pendula]
MRRILIATIFLLTATALHAQMNDHLVSIGEKYTINSRILNEQRRYAVYLPPSYQSNPAKKYFVAYVWDGEKSKFHEVTGIAQSMTSIHDLKMQIPEIIIVSIENINRTSDFTPTFIELPRCGKRSCL